MSDNNYDKYELSELKELQDSDPVVKEIIHEYYLLRPSFYDEETVIANTIGFNQGVNNVCKTKGDFTMNFCAYCGQKRASVGKFCAFCGQNHDSISQDECDMSKSAFEEEVEEKEEEEDEKQEKIASVLRQKVSSVVAKFDALADYCEENGKESIAMQIDAVSDELENAFGIEREGR